MASDKDVVLKDPPYIDQLFGSVRFAWVWAIVRIWLGWQWFQAGLHKVGDPAWVGGGSALRGYWTRAVAIPETGNPPVSYDWYRAFLQFLLDGGHYTWFAKLVAWGELLVGVGLILGALTGFAAFFGALMNFNFMLAGSASTNPVMFLLAVLLLLAWKTAGWIGVDRWLLPLLGTPWEPGTLKPRRTKSEAAS